MGRLRNIIGTIPGTRRAWRLGRGLLFPHRRAIERLKNGGDGAFQPWPTTAPDRYPQVFDFLAEQLSGKDAPALLSYGCASGEEVEALARRMPHARITGLDTNAHAIAQARRRVDLPNVAFTVSDRPDPAERYDAILAMAVFRDGRLNAATGTLPDCGAILPFARVEAGIGRLVAVLKPGGWLALANSHFDFEDMETAHGFEAALPIGENLGTGPLYGRDDRLKGKLSRRPALLYRKLP